MKMKMGEPSLPHYARIGYRKCVSDVLKYLHNRCDDTEKLYLFERNEERLMNCPHEEEYLFLKEVLSDLHKIWDKELYK